MPAAHCLLAVKAVPNAPRTEIAGWWGNALKVRVHAPALDGRAKEDRCGFLAVQLRLPRRSVTLVQGEESRPKVIRVAGLSLADTRSRLMV